MWRACRRPRPDRSSPRRPIATQRPCRRCGPPVPSAPRARFSPTPGVGSRHGFSPPACNNPTLDRGGIVALSAIPLGELGEHGVVGGQLGVVVAGGGTVESFVCAVSAESDVG